MSIYQHSFDTKTGSGLITKPRRYLIEINLNFGSKIKTSVTLYSQFLFWLTNSVKLLLYIRGRRFYLSLLSLSISYSSFAWSPWVWFANSLTKRFESSKFIEVFSGQRQRSEWKNLVVIIAWILYFHVILELNLLILQPTLKPIG